MPKTRKAESPAGAAKPPVPKSSKSKTAPAPAAAGINTTLAAESAARFVAAKVPLPAGPSTTKESAAFRHLKEGLNKPAAAAMASFLDKSSPAGQKRPNLPQFGGKQVGGRNQTFGADVNRTGVPRRTPG